MIPGQCLQACQRLESCPLRDACASLGVEPERPVTDLIAEWKARQP